MEGVEAAREGETHRHCKDLRKSDVMGSPPSAHMERLEVRCLAFFIDALVGSYREAFLARLGFYNPKRPGTNCRWASSPPAAKPSLRGSLPRASRSCPQHPAPQRQGSPAGRTPVGEHRPRARGSQGGRWQRPGRECPPVLAGSPPASERGRKQEDSTGRVEIPTGPHARG